MKRIYSSIILLFSLFAALPAQAQTLESACPHKPGEIIHYPADTVFFEDGTSYIEPPFDYVYTQEDYDGCCRSFRRDSLRALDRDTTGGNNIHVGIVGDVISGYSFDVEQAYPDSVEWDETETLNGVTYVNHYCEYNQHKMAFRWYHKDYAGKRVRQIVVLRTRWTNLPDDIATYTETHYSTGEPIYTVDGGYRLAALTQKEYKELKERNLIWGECFECCYAAGTERMTQEEKERTIGYEIVCYNEDSLPLWKAPTLGAHQRKITREIMSYTDPTDGKDYMCAAPNKTTSTADYTKEGSDGKYETRWVAVSDQEAERWWQKYINWIKSTMAYRLIKNWWKSV